jgi:hypothetical protein
MHTAAVAAAAAVVQEVGYPESSTSLVADVMMSKNIPDPRDIRKHDLIGPLGMVNFKTLQVRAAVGVRFHVSGSDDVME